MASFQAADANADGVLSKEEMRDFVGKLGQNAGARGVPHMDAADVAEEVQEAVWGLYNGKTEGADGVSMADFGAVTEELGAKIRSLM